MAHGAAPALVWSTRPEVVTPLLVVAGAYAVGWWRLHRRGGSVSGWRVAAAAGGLASLAVALSTPLERMAHASFAAHMAQHLLLIAAAAPLLLLANPFALLVWALPSPVRGRVGRWLRSGARLRRLWHGLTLMSVAWLAHAAAMWLWHLPIAYDAAVGVRALHDLEHLLFFGTAVLFWWAVIQPAPRFRPPAGYGTRVVFLVLAALQASLLGLLLTMSPGWYRAYPSAEDQSLGGLLMWAVGGAVDMLAVLVLMGRYLGAQEQTPALTSRDREVPRASRL